MKTLLATAAAIAASFTAPAEAATSKRVLFESAGQRLVGDLYLPDGYKAGDKLPAVVVTGAWMTVKEQMPARYAASSPTAAMRRSPSTSAAGASRKARAQPREPEHEDRGHRSRRRLSWRPARRIDAGRIGGLGICASAGYMAGAVAASPHLRSMALVAPWLHDSAIVDQVYGGREGVAKLVSTGRAAADRFARTGVPMLVPAASTTDKSAIMQQAPYYTDRTRGLIPNGRTASTSPPGRLADLRRGVDRTRLGGKPVAMVHSDAAAIPEGARSFYAKVAGPKRELWLENVSQFDFYDQAQPVSRAADFVADHFASTMK
jgi:fermentation-respiration switch protein FrsA (DUF1100 family)